MSATKPHAILYVFQVKKGHEQAFEAAWCDVTREIQAHWAAWVHGCTRGWGHVLGLRPMAVT